jgi:hypothetical protein
MHVIKRTSFFFNSFPRGGLPRKAQVVPILTTHKYNIMKIKVTAGQTLEVIEEEVKVATVLDEDVTLDQFNHDGSIYQTVGRVQLTTEDGERYILKTTGRFKNMPVKYAEVVRGRIFDKGIIDLSNWINLYSPVYGSPAWLNAVQDMEG